MKVIIEMNNVTHTEVSSMDMDISPQNHLPNQGEQTQPPSSLQLSFLPSRGSREQGVPSLQLRGIKPLENVQGAEALPPSDIIQCQINLQSPDNECMECAPSITYENYIELKTKKKLRKNLQLSILVLSVIQISKRKKGWKDI